MSLKVILVYFSLFALLLSCNKDNGVLSHDDEHSAFHTIDIHVSSSDGMDSRVASPAEIKVIVADIALVVVDKQSNVILDIAMMQKKSEGSYSCKIASSVDLTASHFYAVANVEANFTNLYEVKGKTFDYLLDIQLHPTRDDHNIASASPLHYVLMNKTAATYDSATKTLSPITLSRLPARVYLNCEKLGYPVERVTFKNIAKQTSLRTIIDQRGNGRDADLTDWIDTDPQIIPQGKDYYYLIYPSSKSASLTVTANSQDRQVDLGVMKPGYSYKIRINYPEDISFDGIATNGVINMVVGTEKKCEFRLSNTAHVRKVTLTSSDDNIFLIDQGTDADWYKFGIFGATTGEATLTATCDNVTIQCKVIVSGALAVTVNGQKVGEFANGETVNINSPFKAKKKFSSWANNPLIPAEKLSSPSFTFTMPGQNVDFTANYADAPYKITVLKPGLIANDRSGTIEAALVEKTDQGDVRYYAEGDEVCITIPNEDKLFKFWGSTDTWVFNNFATDKGGGGNKNPSTWLKMPIPSDNIESTIEPFFKLKPYWSSRTTTKGRIIANFIDRLTDDPYGASTIPGGAKFGRAYTEEEKSAIMRALAKVENIFADAPRRPLRINFAITTTNIPGAGGGTEPQIARRDLAPAPYEYPKLKWLESDFGGIAVGKKAASSKFEAVWRDKKNIVPEYAEEDNGFVDVCDGSVILSNSYVSDSYMYKGESIDGFKPLKHMYDLETVIMHEVFHIIFYHTHNVNYDENGEGLTALDVYISHVGDPTRRLLYGNFIPDTQGQIVSEAAKKYLGYYPPLQPNYFAHPNMGYGIGAVNFMGGWEPTINEPRRFVDFELAMLQEMGWNINPAAWKNPPKTPAP